MKRVLSLFLCLMCISILCVPVFADPTTSPSPEPTPTETSHVEAGKNEMGVYADIDGTEPGSYKLTIGKLGTVKGNGNSEMTNILKQYRVVIAIITGVGALTMLLMFLLNFAKLGQSGGNPQMRQSAIIGLLFTGGATALLGSVMTFFAFFYNFIPN